MSITINLPPKVESEFIAAARERNLPVDELMTEVLLRHGPAPSIRKGAAGEERAELAARLDILMDAMAEKAKDIPEEKLDLLIDEALEAVRRE